MKSTSWLRRRYRRLLKHIETCSCIPLCMMPVLEWLFAWTRDMCRFRSATSQWCGIARNWGVVPAFFGIYCTSWVHTCIPMSVKSCHNSIRLGTCPDTTRYHVIPLQLRCVVVEIVRRGCDLSQTLDGSFSPNLERLVEHSDPKILGPSMWVPSDSSLILLNLDIDGWNLGLHAELIRIYVYVCIYMIILYGCREPFYIFVAWPQNSSMHLCFIKVCKVCLVMTKDHPAPYSNPFFWCSVASLSESLAWCVAWPMHQEIIPRSIQDGRIWQNTFFKTILHGTFLALPGRNPPSGFCEVIARQKRQPWKPNTFL